MQPTDASDERTKQWLWHVTNGLHGPEDLAEVIFFLRLAYTVFEPAAERNREILRDVELQAALKNLLAAQEVLSERVLGIAGRRNAVSSRPGNSIHEPIVWDWPEDAVGLFGHCMY